MRTKRSSDSKFYIRSSSDFIGNKDMLIFYLSYSYNDKRNYVYIDIVKYQF